jgi:hypothetical protein
LDWLRHENISWNDKIPVAGKSTGENPGAEVKKLAHIGRTREFPD